MEQLVRATRRGGVILVALFSVLAGLGLISWLFAGDAAARASTTHLLALLGFLILPIVTLGLLRLDQQAVREREGR